MKIIFSLFVNVMQYITLFYTIIHKKIEFYSEMEAENQLQLISINPLSPPSLQQILMV